MLSEEKLEKEPTETGTLACDGLKRLDARQSDQVKFGKVER